MRGFPTIYFKPAGADGLGRVVTYDGPREAADMAEWLADKATHAFDVPAALAKAAPKKPKASKKGKAAEAEPPRGAPVPGHEEL